MLGPLCDEVIKLVQFSPKADGVTIAIKGRIAVPILGNPIQIQQVLVNLIDNAIEAGGNTSNRAIELEFSERPGRAALAVRDYGPGFSPEVLENLFDLFRTTRESGTGIGLWLCRQIVEKHKGTISAFNHSDGGACVRVEFPAAGIPT
ncbi:ATPase/histidine kinase/DNA gyrase B/HSP90 domain protein [Ostertagia ostertagi]